MHIAVTGATGFLGRYIVNHLLAEGHTCRCWYRQKSDRGGFRTEGENIEWIRGELHDAPSALDLVKKVDAVVHAALWRPSAGLHRVNGDLLTFIETNVLGSIHLMQAAIDADVKRFVFISTCAVHDRILDDRPLDEAHPLWPASHYGAHKAAIEKFVHSFGMGQGYPICALRPTGIYGVDHPANQSKWYSLVRDAAQGKPIERAQGGKEVHADDVARAVAILLNAPEDAIRGESFNCYDMYIADQTVARIASELAGSDARVADLNRGPKHQIETGKLRALGMRFGGEPLLRDTIRDLLDAIAVEGR